MKTVETTQWAPSADSTNAPDSSVPESATIAIEGRIGLAMFVIVGFVLGLVMLAELLSGFFR
jgi:hypothetical protein